MKILRKLMRNEKGATAIEYGLIATIISIGIITAATKIGGNVSSIFNQVSSNITK